MLTRDASRDERRNAVMSAHADMLWWFSHEYGQCLAKASSYLELLEQLLLERGSEATQAELLNPLHEAWTYLGALREDFRTWRYGYFYETADSKRMVQGERAIQTAIGTFQQMRGRHLEYLVALGDYFNQLPRPSSSVTLVPTGDLWDLLGEALVSLIDFDRDVRASDVM